MFCTYLNSTCPSVFVGSFGRRVTLAGPGGLGTCGWLNVGRWKTRGPSRGHLTRVPTAVPDPTPKSSPSAFGTRCRLGLPATEGWAGTGGHSPGLSHAPIMSAGEAISGPNRPEGYIADNRLLTWISVSAPQAGGLTPCRLSTARGRRVEGSPRRLGRWPDRVAAPQRTRSTTTWTHSPADAYSGLRGSVGIQPVVGHLPSQGYLLTRGTRPRPGAT